MKALKIIGVIVAAIILGVVGMALIAPTHVRVERSVTVDAPGDFVWTKVNTLAAMTEWSPWVELDPDQETSIEGEDGTVGAIYSWSGDENVGSGTQEITEVSEGFMKMRLHFIEPFEGEADASIAMEEMEDGQTKVTWAYDQDSPFPMNAMNLFINMDDMLGPDFQKGMDNLGALVAESKGNRTEFNGYTVQRMEVPVRTVLGVHDTIEMSEMKAFFEMSLPKSAMAVQEAGMEMTGMPCAAYIMWDDEGQRCELVAGMPVAQGGTLDGFQTVDVGGEMLVVEYYGAYEGVGGAHEAVDAYMQWHGIEMTGPVMEEYVTDPTTESDPNNWLTKVYYSI